MTPPLIMVVEDNPITRKVVRLLLEGEGFGVIDAPDAKTALDLAATLDLALIIQDMRLPDLGGFELLERLRALPGLAEIPILAVTGFLPERTGGTAEFTDVLIKPVAPSRLLAVIKARLVTHFVQSSQPIRTIRMRVLLAEDDVVQRKLMRLLLVQWGFDVTEAVNGAEALRLAIASTPDLIVSDLLMPELDGLGLCVAVRRIPALAAVPVVLVSSYHLDEVDLSLVSHSGAIAIVSRSHDMAELAAALSSVMAHEVKTRVESVEPAPSMGQDIGRLVGKLQREADARTTLVESQAALSALLLFFERFADVSAQTGIEREDVDRTIDELLAAYLDASGASLGCAFLIPSSATTVTGLVLRSHIGYRGPTVDDLSSFFGRRDLLERVLVSGTTLALPSPEIQGPDIDVLLERTDATSLLLIPLLIKHERLGVLVLGSHRSSSSLDRLRVAEAVRGPIAQALTLSRTVAELVTSRQAFRGIVDSTSDGIVVADTSARITYANPAALSTFGYSPYDLIGRSVSEIMPFTEAPAGRTGTGVRKDGTTFPAAVTVTLFEDSPGHVLHAHLVRDLGQREMLDQLALLVNTDGLTGLASRRRFDEHMTSRLAEAQRYRISGALVMLDLDGFKAINDGYGHPAGDAVLRAVAAVLRIHTRGSDFIARLGGDELAIEMPHTGLAAATAVTGRWLAAVREPIVWKDQMLRVGMSAGIAMYPDDGMTLDAIVAAGDAALYESKRAGRNRVSSTDMLRGAA